MSETNHRSSLPALSRETVQHSPTRRNLVLKQISAAKVCGLGGGRFDTSTKLRSGSGAKALIINAMQSEPDNNSDMALLQEAPETVIAGAALAALCVVDSRPNETKAALQIVLALPERPRLPLATATAIDAAVARETRWLTQDNRQPVDIRCTFLNADHASGEEHQLAESLGLLNDAVQRKPELRSAPLVEAGIVCLNLATAYAIAQAVYAGETLRRRMVSVNGEARWLEFGTHLRAVIDAQQTLDSVWVNGRHGGTAASSNAEHERVHAGMFCVSDAPSPPVAACINCSACVPACPVDLRPDELYQQLDRDRVPQPHLHLENCLECGACNAVCPSQLPLAQAFRAAKAEQVAAREKDRLAQKAKQRSDARTARLAAIEADRKARALARGKSNRRAW